MIAQFCRSAASAPPGFFVLRRGQGLPPLSPHLFLRYRRPSSAALRIVFLDEDEHFLHNRTASVATLREPFAFGPECRSRSLRNQCSPSPESSLIERGGDLDGMRQYLVQLFPGVPHSALTVVEQRCPFVLCGPHRQPAEISLHPIRQAGSASRFTTLAASGTPRTERHRQ
jgi:hypothetical protein